MLTPTIFVKGDASIFMVDR